MIRETIIAERRTLRMPFPASLPVSVGDLLYWDNSAKFAKPATSRTDTGSKAGNQADFTPLFAGVAADQRLAAETSVTTVASQPTGPSDRLVIPEGIFDCDCTSATFEFGDLVGIDRDATPLNTPQQVIGVAQASLAIGYVLKREPAAVTKVRCYLTAFGYGWFKQRSSMAIGYVTGQGGTVTQATSKSTGVTLSTLSGQITMNAAALGSATAVSFTVTNTLVAAGDVVVVNHASGGTTGGYLVSCTAVAAGSFKVTIYNVSGGSLSEAVVIGFDVLKGATA